MGRLRPWLLVARIYVLPTPTKKLAPVLDVDLSIRKSSFDELRKAALEFPNLLNVDQMRSAFDRGDICVAAFHGGRVVGFAWGSLSTAPHVDGVQVKISPPYVYGYKSYVLPQFRGRHLSATLIHVRDQIFRMHGRHTSVGFVETHNYASIAINKHMGSELVGYAGYVSLFGRYCCFRTRGVRPHTFEFTRVLSVREAADRHG